MVAAHYKKDDLLPSSDISGYHADFHEGHGTIRVGQGARHSTCELTHDMAREQHATCELTQGMAGERHAMCESAFILLCMGV